MKLHFFNVPAKYPEDAQKSLSTFCTQHRVLNIEKQFVSLGNESYWSICVTIMEGEAVDIAQTIGNKRTNVDYKEILGEQDFAVYVQLRNLRKTLSEQEGIPAYTLFTNAQLAEMVTQHVSTIPELGKIEGIGKARLEKYGQLFLKALQAARKTPDKPNSHAENHETQKN